MSWLTTRNVPQACAFRTHWESSLVQAVYQKVVEKVTAQYSNLLQLERSLILVPIGTVPQHLPQPTSTLLLLCSDELRVWYAWHEDLFLLLADSGVLRLACQSSEPSRGLRSW